MITPNLGMDGGLSVCPAVLAPAVSGSGRQRPPAQPRIHPALPAGSPPPSRLTDAATPAARRTAEGLRRAPRLILSLLLALCPIAPATAQSGFVANPLPGRPVLPPNATVPDKGVANAFPRLQLIRAFNPTPTAMAPEDLYADEPITLEMVFHNLPAGTRVVSLDTSRYPAGAITPEIAAQPSNPSGTEYRRNLRFRIRKDAVAADHVVPLHIVARVTGSDGKIQTFNFSDEHVILVPFRRYIFDDTSSFEYMFSGEQQFRPMLPDFSACRGNSSTPHGTFPVGISVRDRKVRFTIRSGPAGTTCQWIGTLNRPNIPYPFRLIAVTFTAETNRDSKCLRPQVLTEQPAQPANSNNPRAEWLQVGNGRQEMAPLNLSHERLPILVVTLHCGATLFNDHYVNVTFDSIEVEGPENRRIAVRW